MKYFKMIAITAMMALATISCTKSPMFEPEMPEPLDLLYQVPVINFSPNLSVYDGLTGGGANG